MMDRMQRRIALAVAASVLLHAWLAHTIEGGGARRVQVMDVMPLTATLAAPAADVMAPAALPDAPALGSAPAPVAAPRESPGMTVPQPPSPIGAGAQVTPSAVPGDPTYYAARSLDVFPTALTALDLGVAAGAGQVRATVLIDESGVVNDVRAIQAAAVAIENAARELLWRTRFTPAAKDGRIVKAQVVVSLDYGAPSAP